jgi:hypothetical protein
MGLKAPRPLAFWRVLARCRSVVFSFKPFETACRPLKRWIFFAHHARVTSLIPGLMRRSIGL